MSEEKQQKNRIGNTITTSVSVSREMQDLVILHNLSPTEIYRRGVAVMLYDTEIEYKNPLNERRKKYVEEFLQKLAEDEKMRELADQIIKLADMLKGLNVDELKLKIEG